MIRITKQTDYGLVLLAQMAKCPGCDMFNARDLAEETGIAFPMTRKILKQLAREGLLQSHRGASGGYSLTRTPAEISVADIISALEGPIALVDCVDHECAIENCCPTHDTWHRVNNVIVKTLEAMTLDELLQPNRKTGKTASKPEDQNMQTATSISEKGN